MNKEQNENGKSLNDEKDIKNERLDEVNIKKDVLSEDINEENSSNKSDKENINENVLDIVEDIEVVENEDVIVNKANLETEIKDKGNEKEKNTKNGTTIFKNIVVCCLFAVLFAFVSSLSMKVFDGILNKKSTNNVVIGSEKESDKISQDEEVKKMGVILGDVSAIVEKAMPSVVAIRTKTKLSAYTWFGRTREYETESSGSGIIIGRNNDELLIVTNNHVVENSDSLFVMFIDNKEAKATVKGGDAEADIAVISVDLKEIDEETRKNIEIATIGNSETLKVGAGVVAIGNALGYGQSVTVGYISALNREVQLERGFTRRLLQTDAAINPGNSGGALLNAKGELIAINSAKYSSTSVEGMGYAIPINEVEELIKRLATREIRSLVEEGQRAYLGIQGQNIDISMSKAYDIPAGVYVYKIVDETGAKNSELKEKDVITHFDSQRIYSLQELKNLLDYYRAGEEIEITVQRLEAGEYKEKVIKVKLSKR